MNNYKKISLIILCAMCTSILNAEDIELKDISPTKSIAVYVQSKLNECQTKLRLANAALQASKPDLQAASGYLTTITNILCKDISLEILDRFKKERGEIETEIEETQQKINGQNKMLQALLKEKQEELEKTQNATLGILNNTIYQELATGYTKDGKTVAPVIRQNIQSWNEVKRNFPNLETSKTITNLNYADLQKLALTNSAYSWIFEEGKTKKSNFDLAIKKAVEYCYKLVAILKTLKAFEKNEDKQKNIQTIINWLEQEYIGKIKNMQWPAPMVPRRDLSWPNSTQNTNFEKFKKDLSELSTFISQLQDPFTRVQTVANNLK